MIIERAGEGQESGDTGASSDVQGACESSGKGVFSMTIISSRGRLEVLAEAALVALEVLAALIAS
jgi:hypothetical protein